MSSPQVQFSDYYEAISEHSEYDFVPYSESINKRLINFIADERIGSPIELKQKLNSDGKFHMKLLEGVTVRYTEVFRDPYFFMSLRNKVLPYLSTFSEIKIWIAGCATGEEVYSLAILLEEYELLDKATIYASDINADSIKIAERGVYHPTRIREYTLNYGLSGGRLSFGKYYSVQNDMLVMSDKLKCRVKFFQSDLIKDIPEHEYDLILCRNVLFYFKEEFQRNIVNKIAESLRNYGYFATGINEKISEDEYFKSIDDKHKIYRKVIRL